jgi:UDP-glucose 4-epimerase
MAGVKMTYQHALVTGGAGFIGSRITEMLLDKGLKATVLDNLSVGKRENVPTGATLIEGDIDDFQLVKGLTRQCDIVFHEAARVTIRASIDTCYEDAQTNLMGTINMLRACEQSAVRKFVLASSMAVYSDSPIAKPIDENFDKEPLSPYGISKLAAEKYVHLLCRMNSIDSIVLRYFNTFGPRQTFTPYVGVITIFINKLLKGERPMIFGDGNQLRDFVYVGDIARANILAMESGATGITVNIGTGIPTSVNQIAALLIERLNPTITPEFGPARPEELKISYPEISQAKRLIGYAPRYRLEDKINEVIAYIKGQV